MQRRHFIKACSFAPLFAFLGGNAFVPLPIRAPDLRREEYIDILKRLPSPSSVVKRACGYLRAFDPLRLLMTSNRSLSSLVKQKIADDYRRGKIVSVDGWILSETEVGMCVAAKRYNEGRLGL